jgi:hypothetical protein
LHSTNRFVVVPALVDIIMTLRLLIVLASTLQALSAYVVEPYGGGGYYGAPAPFTALLPHIYSGTIVRRWPR